ncbi:MAG: coat protein [Cressdnaviricota sp.]|nr:MAG: coat protein [Cressdnaviricota sp.]
MPARKAPKSARTRKAYPKRRTVRSTVLQRSKTLEYVADPVPPYVAQSLMSKEQKFLDLGQVDQNCNPSPLITDIIHLNQIGQGTSVNTRVGMRYQMTGVHIRGQFYQNGPQNVVPSIAGYFLVYDSEPQGTLATAAEMFNVNYTDMHFAFPNGSSGQKGGRFQYLARKEFFMGNAGSGTNPVEMDGVLPGTRLINDFIPLNRLITQCSRLNTGASISTIQKGALLVVPFGRAGAPVTGTALVPKMNFAWRLYFAE